MSSNEGITSDADKDPCPLDCPNRRRSLSQGITLRFAPNRSIHADPFEILLWLLLMLPAGVLIREAPKTSFEEALKRVGLMAGAMYGIHKMPTGKIYDFLSGGNQPK